MAENLSKLFLAKYLLTVCPSIQWRPIQSVNVPLIHAAWSNSALSNILPSKRLNTSEENPAPKQVQALQHIIIPVMWMSEAEVRAAPFSFWLRQCGGVGRGVFLLTSPEGGCLSLSRGMYWWCETACYTLDTTFIHSCPSQWNQLPSVYTFQSGTSHSFSQTRTETAPRPEQEMSLRSPFKVL